MHDYDLENLRDVIAMAAEGIPKGYGPFAARLVIDGKVIAEARNSVIHDRDPTAHAEMNVIREASQKLDDHVLEGAILYASAEPCPMCMAAAHWARIKRVVYAASNRDAGAAGFDDLHILQELCTTSILRDLPMEQGLRKEGVAVFDEWVRYEDKVEY